MNYTCARFSKMVHTISLVCLDEGVNKRSFNHPVPGLMLNVCRLPSNSEDVLEVSFPHFCNHLVPYLCIKYIARFPVLLSAGFLFQDSFQVSNTLEMLSFSHSEESTLGISRGGLFTASVCKKENVLLKLSEHYNQSSRNHHTCNSQKLKRIMFNCWNIDSKLCLNFTTSAHIYLNLLYQNWRRLLFLTINMIL